MVGCWADQDNVAMFPGFLVCRPRGFHPRHVDSLEQCNLLDSQIRVTGAEQVSQSLQLDASQGRRLECGLNAGRRGTRCLRHTP